VVKILIEFKENKVYYGSVLRNRRFICFLSIFLLCSSLTFGQGRGAIFDDEYDNLPRRAELATRSYEGLPGSFSLKQYAPLPGDQADYGTCVGWASAYAARTISESIALNRLSQTETTQNVFSPIHLYKNIRPDDTRGLQGAQIYSALDFLRDNGAVRMLEIERDISFTRIDLDQYKLSRQYPIAGYVTLFSRDDRQKQALITRIVKKSLTEGKPVIIGMNTPDSFNDAREVWRPRENPQFFYYGHALCVVGYDDNRYGGAFEVLNSWGRKWGNGGFIWIPYDVFINFVMEAYEIIDNIASYSDTIRFDGFINMEISNIEQHTRTASFALTQSNYYKATETITEGTEISFTVGARESAYVYSFSVSQPIGHDNFYSPVILFPQTGISPLLNYSDSIITLPGENRTITINESGTKYIITLYAKQSLDIQNIIRVFLSTQGTINKRLSAAIGDGYTTELFYNENEAAFTATPDDPRTVAALIVAITTE